MKVNKCLNIALSFTQSSKLRYNIQYLPMGIFPEGVILFTGMNIEWKGTPGKAAYFILSISLFNAAAIFSFIFFNSSYCFSAPSLSFNWV